MELLTERYADRIQTVLSCFDRLIRTGTLVEFGHAKVATHELYRRGVRIFDFPALANRLREALRAHAVARAHGLTIEFLPSAKRRKESRIQEVFQGTRIKHHMGEAALKMYDKLGQVLRLETVANDVTFFKHHRRVEHRDGTWEIKNAPVRKTIYSLPALADLMGAANRRYLAFLSTLDDSSTGWDASSG